MNTPSHTTAAHAYDAALARCDDLARQYASVQLELAQETDPRMKSAICSVLCDLDDRLGVALMERAMLADDVRAERLAKVGER